MLASGLAGSPRRQGRALLYETHRVAALASRPVLGAATLRRECPRGWFVARRGEPARLATRADQLSALSEGWDDVSFWTMFAMGYDLDRSRGPFAFIATVGGCVYLGADLVGLQGRRLVLADPGPWFEVFRGTRLPTGPGRPWHIRLHEDAARAA
ncbi:hypothetical protein D9V37_09940 [Nocardioides mangrovicus]|uniref:Uncharacterized protein n=1 Tax=Nocardioides mangrovicus TaxID=2478913 RepID=A0A3L8P2W4_9ACTN|nr:hypothetical protein D9V37_09940 [Nocardioides mangrovicus]